MEMLELKSTITKNLKLTGQTQQHKRDDRGKSANLNEDKSVEILQPEDLWDSKYRETKTGKLENGHVTVSL